MRSSTEQARGSFAATSGVTPELPMALATCEVKEQEWRLQTPKEGEALQPRGGRRGHGAARARPQEAVTSQDETQTPRKQGDWHKEKWLPRTRRPETPKEGWNQQELVLKATESS